MRIIALAALVFASVAEVEFDPAAAMKALIDGAKETQAEVDEQTSAIESKLRAVTRHKESSSFLQTKSLSSMRKEIAEFEKSKSALLEKDLKEVTSKRDQFDSSLQRLRRDSAQLASHGASFLEKPAVDFFEGPKRMVQNIHTLVQGFKSDTQAHGKPPAAKPVESFDMAEMDLE
jgi:hypothetical protein